MSGPRARPPLSTTRGCTRYRDWFQLVDDDGSGTLEADELMAALEVGWGGVGLGGGGGGGGWGRL